MPSFPLLFIIQFFPQTAPPPSRLPIIIATIACIITTINAIFSIANVVLSRRRMVRVKSKYRKFGEGYPGGNRYMTFDVTSIGAPIHDIEMSLYIDARKVVQARGEPALTPQEHDFDLVPLYTVAQPLNAGQSQVYDLSMKDFKNDNGRKAIKNALMQLDHKAVAIRVYCNGKRTTLKTISSKKLKATLDELFQHWHINPEIATALDAESAVAEDAESPASEGRD